MSKAESERWFLYAAAGAGALGGLLFGYSVGVVSGAILFIQSEFGLSPSVEGLVVSASSLGAILGVVSGGILSDRFGRKRTLLAAAVAGIAGAVGTALSPSIGSLIGSQVVAGVAMGVASFGAPLYISEIAPAPSRGRMVSLNQIGLTGGIVAAYAADYALSSLSAWRWMFAAAALPAAALGMAMAFMPESPRWLMVHHRAADATSVLKKLRGKVPVDGEMRAIEDSLRGQSGSWRDLTSPHLRPALLTGIGLALFQQGTGINAVLYYAPTIFQLAGFENASSAILATVGIGTVNVLVTVVAMQLLDRVGRRPLLLISLAGMAACMAVLGFSFHLAGLVHIREWLALVGLTLFVAFFAIGLGPVFWLLIAEIYPLAVRGLAMSVATLANWAANLLTALFFLDLVEAIGRAGTFWFFCLIGVISLFFVRAWVPETKGKSLEEIEAQWSGVPHLQSEGG